MQDDEQDFHRLVAEAADAPLRGWDFSFLSGRTTSEALPWDYQQLARRAAARAKRVMDVDTGGGEFFAALGPQAGSIAVEPWPPNLAVAAETLAPFGVEVRERIGRTLPAHDGEVDLVLNRHGTFDADEVARVLCPGGVFVTQQVGSRNDVEINEAFGVPVHDGDGLTSAEAAAAAAQAAGLEVERCDEAWPRTRYLDVGALVLQLRAVSWQIPDFSVATHLAQLRRVHDQIRDQGSFTLTGHRLLLVARRR